MPIPGVDRADPAARTMTLAGFNRWPPGRFRPNGFGLYHMHGNVCEWCADRYGKEYYAASPVNDPAGPDSGRSLVVRGGSWFGGSWSTRSAYRATLSPDGRIYHCGFRVSRTP